VGVRPGIGWARRRRTGDAMWKADWDQTRRRFVDWWNRDGLLIGMWGAPEAGRPIHEDVAAPAVPLSLAERYCDAGFRAAQNHHRLSRSLFPADVLPLATTDIGPGSLALLCGAEPEFAEETVWFHSSMGDAQPEAWPPLRFDPGNAWWRITESVVSECVRRSRGEYLVGCPDLIENVDVLASLRGVQPLLLDMLERPDWVERRVWEINEVWFETYRRIHDLIRLDDGSCAFGAFYLWGPGKTAKVQCDTSAMFSPSMYRRFVAPALTAQCAWLDHSLYHLDGTQALAHLDTLLEIEPLDAIEWTPQAGIEQGGHPRWYDLYRRILGAGKSVQIVNVARDEILPLLEAIGRKGVYILTTFADEREAARLLERIGGR
jgi:hypothetical protein